MMGLFRRLAFLPPAASTVADSVDGLHAWVLGITMFGTFAVFLATFWMLVRFRGEGRAGTTPHVRPPIWLEAGVIIALLAMFLAFWVRGYTDYLYIRATPERALPVYVTGRQWFWEFTWPDGARSQDMLVVPVNQPIRLVMSSRDVIHSFFVPAFRVKEDLLPGACTRSGSGSPRRAWCLPAST